jgi:hypothetical protein
MFLASALYFSTRAGGGGGAWPCQPTALDQEYQWGKITSTQSTHIHVTNKIHLSVAF